MAIRSGIGIGEAQVFDTSGLANQYAKQVAADQANLQRQAIANQKINDEFLKDLAGTVASTKTLGNGLHPEDVKQLNTYQDEIRQLYSKANQAKTPQERAMIKAEVDKSFEQQLEYVNGAKYFRQAGGDLFKDMVANPEDYDDLSRNEVKDLLSSSYINAVGKGKGVINNTTYQRRPDQASYVKAIDNIESFVDKGAGQDIKDNKLQVSGNLQRMQRTINPQLVYNYAKELINSSDATKFYLKSKYKLDNPNAVGQPSDDDLTGMIVKDYVTRKGADAYSSYDKFSRIPSEPKAPQSEIEQAKLLKERVGNIKSLVENKDQTVFESLKSSLPVNSKVKWLTTKGKVIGMQIDAPKSYDDEGNLIGAISQRIDFTKGDPYKTINVIMNRYFGKKIPNESLQSQRVGGNVRVNKIADTKTQSTKPTAKKTYVGIDKNGNPIFK
jgi:hypothetical protein